MPDNVAQFPTKLERLETSIRGLLVRDAANQKEWVEIKLSLCAELADAREAFRANQEFGNWCRTHFDISRHDREAYIAMGRDLELAQKVLEKTQRKSVRHIYEQEFKPKRNNVVPIPSDGAEAKPIRSDGTLGKRRTKTSGKLVQEPSSSRFSEAFKTAETPEDRQPTPEHTALELMCVNLREMREGFKRAEAGYRGFEHARKNLVNDPRESIAIHAVKHDLERIGLFIEELWPFISKFLPEGAQAGPQTASGLLTINHER